MEKKTIFLTGATGVMGFATLQALADRFDRFDVRILVRDSAKNRKKLAPFRNEKALKIVWGNLLNREDVKRALGNATVVLHLGGMVSPAADYHPEITLKVNVEGTANVLSAVKDSKNRDIIRLAYIGSVAQMSNRSEPYHWGRVGDPLQPAAFDTYSLSKIEAERLVAESGLNYWVSLRQSGILHPGLFLNAFDPIAFHVPLRGALEWATLEDSAALMVRLCDDDIPDSFWKNFYHIGSGEPYRLSNYEFIRRILGAIKCPAPEKVFEPSWFATRNFHGVWFSDSDVLENILHFRRNIPVDDYFKSLAKQAPWWVKLAPLAPGFVMKAVMKSVANKKPLGTLYWLKSKDNEERIRAAFGSREEQAQIPGWDSFDVSAPSRVEKRLDHGYDESKPAADLDIPDMQAVARHHDGHLLSDSMNRGDLHTPLEWKCANGHTFRATPNTILRGGHWCPVCLHP